jgi:hypothetical protein
MAAYPAGYVRPGLLRNGDYLLLVFSGLITVAALLVTVSRSIRSIPLLSEVTA